MTRRSASSAASVLGIGDVATLAVSDRDPDDLARPVIGGADGVGPLDADIHRARRKALLGIALQRTGQQVGLAEHLKAVADADHGAAASARSLTAFITGANRAIAPDRR